jgi:succinate dehydrogenase hydrophobic anchor subunit
MINLHDIVTSTGVVITLLTIGFVVLTIAWKQDRKEELKK